MMVVPGVGHVHLGFRDSPQVLVDPQRLRQSSTTLAQVIETAGNALEVSPLTFLEASTPGTGGFIDTANQRLNIFHEQAITSADELAQVPLERAGATTPRALGEVATVVEDSQPLIGDAICADEEQCLFLVVEKFPGANTIEVTEGVEAALDAMRPGLGDMRTDSSLYVQQRSSSRRSGISGGIAAGWAHALVIAHLLGLARLLIRVIAMAVSVAAAPGSWAARDQPNLMVVAGT